MLYDKKWDVKAEPSLKGVIAWLETKDPNESYCFIDPQNCAIAQYLRVIGYRQHNSLLTWHIDSILKKKGVGVCFAKSNTFGEVLQKLKPLT